MLYREALAVAVNAGAIHRMACGEYLEKGLGQQRHIVRHQDYDERYVS
jgi:hypothetical protein